MAGRAACLVAKQLLAARSRCLVDTASWWIRNRQTQLIVQQCGKLRGDQIRPLPDRDAKPFVAEAAVATHLSDGHVAVPVRNRPIGCDGFETNPVEPVDRGDD